MMKTKQDEWLNCYLLLNTTAFVLCLPGVQAKSRCGIITFARLSMCLGEISHVQNGKNTLFLENPNLKMKNGESWI